MRRVGDGEILKGLQMGAAHAFDEKAYNVFYPLARADGMKMFELFRAEERISLQV